MIGSYKRQVSIRRVKDVDAFCKLTALPADTGSADLLTVFSNILTKEYGEDRVEPQDRSVMVKFPDGHEEEHRVMEEKDPAQLKNFVQWILAQ